MKTLTKGPGRPKKASNPSVATTTFALVSSKVLKFKQMTRTEKRDKQDNPFIVWYSPRNSSFQAHIMGYKCGGTTIEAVLAECTTYFLKKYNEHYQTNHKYIIDCNFDESIDTWSKDRLLAEYSKLSKRIDDLESNLAKSKNPQDKVEKSRLKHIARLQDNNLTFTYDETQQAENTTL
jgi:hypothetical protein